MIKTVLGEVKESALGVTLSHEHICCYSDYAYRMAKEAYLNKERLVSVSVAYLKRLKEKYALSTFVDCTPVNIGRDIDLLKRVSEQSEVHIVCSTGFYYTEEAVLYSTPAEKLCDFMVTDACAVNAAAIKCAVENATLGDYQRKVLYACARAHLCLGLPIVLHTNAKNQNARKALEILLGEGVAPKAITVAHLSDTENLEYVKEMASYGCFIGLDRLYGITSEEYISKKINSILELCRAGYEDQILLSHDAPFFNGFETDPKTNEEPRLSYVFEHILPRLTRALADKIMLENPARMLSY